MASALAWTTKKVRLDFGQCLAPFPMSGFFIENAGHKGGRFLDVLPLVTYILYGWPVTVICNEHETEIISRKDLPKVIKRTYFENWKNIKHIRSGKTLVGGLSFP